MSVHLNEHLHVHLHNLASSPNLCASSWRTSDSASGQSTDDESEAVEPQSRTSNRSTLLQSKEKPQNQKGKKTKAEVEKPNDLPVAKKHKSMDSDEDDEEPQNEPGTQPLNLFY